MPSLDLVLPCYNPAAGWVKTIIHNITLLQQHLPGTELFVYLINDGSTSGIQPNNFYLLKQSLPNFTLISYEKNQGKGYALRRGMKETYHDFCIYTDVDFPYCTESLVQLYKAVIRKENDIVVGVRDKHYYVNMATNRILVSKFLKLLNQTILHLPVTDTQCGLKGFNQKGREIFLRTRVNRYLFDLEFILLAAKNSQIKLCSIPVKLKSGIIFQKIDGKILITEAISLIKIILAQAIEFLKNKLRK